MMKNSKYVAICADNLTAVEIDSENYKIIKSDSNAKVFKIKIRDCICSNYVMSRKLGYLSKR